MAVVVGVLKAYFIFSIIVMLIYAARHFLFSYNRLFGRQKISYRDIVDSELPSVSVLLPMHNEELVIDNVLGALLKCDYDADKLEIIAINDNSTDRTAEILDEYHGKYPFIRPLHRGENLVRGKPAALNDALEIASGEIVIVFDADYQPTRNLIKKIAMCFSDPQVGAAMGRVVPVNANTNYLTNLLNLERSGGYQVDQQARYNLNLIPQYGGTVGGFRKHLLLESGGFDVHVLAEDTELTYRLYMNGWKIVYDNSAECYEESPETWSARGRQIQRWSRGHNAVMFKYFMRTLAYRKMPFLTKVDALLLLFAYAVPVVLAFAFIDCIALMFLGEMAIFSGWWVLLFIGAYNSWGNFSPFYQIAAGALLDGMSKQLLLLPLLGFSFYFYLLYISIGFFESIGDLLTSRQVVWDKTERVGVKAEPARTGKGVGQAWHT